jgi:hypothetical protein
LRGSEQHDSDAGAQVRDGHDDSARVGRHSLGPGGRFADLSPSGRSRRGDLTTVGQQQAFAVTVNAEYSGELARGDELARLGPAVRRLIETAGERLRS